MSKKKKKKFNVSRYKFKLHVAWSLVVRKRDKYLCQWCLHLGKHNSNIAHHAHHIVARSICGNGGAYEVDNGMTLCYHCHINRLKAEPDEYIQFRDAWLKEHLGIDYHTLRGSYTGRVVFTEVFYDEKVKRLDGFFQEDV